MDVELVEISAAPRRIRLPRICNIQCILKTEPRRCLYILSHQTVDSRHPFDRGAIWCGVCYAVPRPRQSI